MTTDWASFGTPDLFEVAVRWRRDSEPRSRRPRDYGWSVADLRITVAGHNVTSNARGAARQSYVSWYLLPFFEWLVANWAPLLHEEDFAWPTNTTLPAAVACPNALEQWIGATDWQGRELYRRAQAWHRRHGLRAAAEGGLFPDLYLRRYFDTIELSWSSATPPFAGETFKFVAEPGTAYLPVDRVAGPLWDLVNWASQLDAANTEDDQASLRRLASAVEALAQVSTEVLEEAYAPTEVLKLARAALRRRGGNAALEDVRAAGVPVLTQFSPAVAMFGGVSPSLSERDVEALSDYLAKAVGGHDSDALAKLVEDPGFPKARAPYIEGQQLALELLDDLGWRPDEGWVDVVGICADLGIDVSKHKLETDSIRGVALAGAQMSPTILVNLTSPYNDRDEGQRFSIAHELCHVLYDRSRAKRVAITSGAWAPAGVEKRANAFAAMLLMPSALVGPGLSEGEAESSLPGLAKALHVSEHALAEHAHNLGFIDDSARERVRTNARH